jgi:hypothetical protein
VEYTSASAANETAIAGLLSRGSSAAFSATPRRTRAFPIINLATGAMQALDYLTSTLKAKFCEI